MPPPGVRPFALKNLLKLIYYFLFTFCFLYDAGFLDVQFCYARHTLHHTSNFLSATNFHASFCCSTTPLHSRDKKSPGVMYTRGGHSLYWPYLRVCRPQGPYTMFCILGLVHHIVTCHQYDTIRYVSLNYRYTIRIAIRITMSICHHHYHHDPSVWPFILREPQTPVIHDMYLEMFLLSWQSRKVFHT